MQSIVAKRYAKAFWQIATAQEKAGVGSWMQEFVLTLSDKELQKVLSNPTISLASKLGIVQDLLTKERCTANWTCFFQLCLEKRPSELAQICACIYTLYMQANNIHAVNIRVAQALTPEMERAITALLQQQLPAQAVLQIKQIVDPAILGGLVIELGNRTLDLSALQALKNIQKRLIRN